MYFLEQDSDYLFEFYDWGRIQILCDDSPKRGWFYLWTGERHSYYVRTTLNETYIVAKPPPFYGVQNNVVIPTK